MKNRLIKRTKKRIQRLVVLGRRWWTYLYEGVWSDTRNKLSVNITKTISLSVRSFLDTDFQSRACAMAFRTVLAIVPALALLFAMGRGFGVQDVLEQELLGLFPGSSANIADSFSFVDSYLSQTSEGYFVGIGIVFLLWTLISLVSNVERSFNAVWGIKTGRSVWRKLTDYTAMLLILPVLMIFASGLTIFVTNTIQSVFQFSFMTPVIAAMLKVASWVFTWLFFAAVYVLIPNTKVRFKNAFIAGVFAGTCFLILQWAFVSGQIYVTRYNAIYGSFAFVPLLFIWLHFTWIIILAGSVLCYSSQNIVSFAFFSDVASISVRYRETVSLAVLSVIVRSYVRNEATPTRSSISLQYGLPARLVADITDRLIEAGLVTRVIVNQRDELIGYMPAIDPAKITVEMARDRLVTLGRNDFIPDFETTFPGIIEVMHRIEADVRTDSGSKLIADIEINK